MEKRERRERYRHSQAMKQRHGGGNRVDSSSTNSSRDNLPKGNRDSRPPPKTQENEVIDHTAIPDPHMFDNLKRETDDITALTSKKHSKRQVFSNWSKYETLPEKEQDDQKIGEDYETLLRGAQIGAHFQLQSERSWDPKKLPAQNAAFTIDLGVLASSLSCLPLYERLDLPKELFSTDDLEYMERQVRFSKEANVQMSKRRGKSLEKEGLALLGLLSERSEEEFRSLRGDSLERGDSVVADEGKEEELSFGTPPPPRAAVLQKVERATPPKSSPSPPPVLVPPTEEEKEEKEEEEEEKQAVPHATEEPPVQSYLPPPQQNPLRPKVESTEVEEERQLQDTLPQETTAKKKPRSSKNKTNKRRSMEAESERSHQPSLSDTAPVPLHAESPSPSQGTAEASPAVQEVLETPPEAPTVVLEKQSLPRKQENKVEISDAVTRQAKSKSSEAPRISPSKETAQKPEERNWGQEQKSASLEKGDELDELLSLKKAAPQQQSLNFAIPSSAVKASIDEDETLPVHKPVIAEKKEDLEDWLDSMLED